MKDPDTPEEKPLIPDEVACSLPLKYSACMASTVHVQLRDNAAAEHRDIAETRQFSRG